MSAKPSLLDDARYLSFVERYARDLIAFAVEVCGMVPTDEQARVYASMIPPGADAHTNYVDSAECSDALVALPPVTVAVVGLWHMLTRPRSNTYVAVPVMRKWSEELAPAFKLVLSLIDGNAHGWLARYVSVRRDRLAVWAHVHEWFIVARSAPASSPENLAGASGPHLMWIVYDTHEVAPVCLQVIRGSLRHVENRLLQTSRWCKPEPRIAIDPAKPGADRSVVTICDECPTRVDSWSAFRELLNEIDTLQREHPENHVLAPEALAGVLEARSVLREQLVAQGVTDEQVRALFHDIDTGKAYPATPRRQPIDVEPFQGKAWPVVTEGLITLIDPATSSKP